ncbi:class I SAM-dependent methyltransferase [Gilvimarinus sp. 1_MG-2023]|uniref:class I SAM-dependent methyltransferase n=1 Tax=Gilvimarinus sp. 1_MG-2023 TaxID=3062638 RepID=UPI0026E3D2D6|nr:methyltransferase [Gilvimarinus sp. 1_MG-2023]MDO6747161.1 methyltransferase [Gilvimarinus sp. 1_MG-2023]
MKNDPALDWLLTQTPSHGQTLWLCDEHFYQEAARLPTAENHQYLTNRFDIAAQFTEQKLDCRFNDFDLSHIADQTLDTIIYRLSKEKPVVQHCIQQAASKLTIGGQLLIAGLKNEGAKNFLEQAAKTLGTSKATRKLGLAYAATLSKQSHSLPAKDDYTQLHAHPKLAGFFTKPGQFGWQKVDAGSEFLIQTLAQQNPAPAANSLLDLGCGYGYLALETVNKVLAKAPERIVLTDNNAAALCSAERNSQHLAQSQVIAADVGAGIEQRFDMIVCNPPFHQGFQLSGDLTDRFLASAQNKLAPGGAAYFVVNAFIPLESKAKTLFSKIETLANNKQFKVLKLSQR